MRREFIPEAGLSGLWILKRIGEAYIGEVDRTTDFHLLSSKFPKGCFKLPSGVWLRDRTVGSVDCVRVLELHRHAAAAIPERHLLKYFR